MINLDDRIYDAIFVNGYGKHADRLALLDVHGNDIGGWGWPAFSERIRAIVLDAEHTARRQERERCCKAVCSACEAGATVTYVGGKWWHSANEKVWSTGVCNASAIRSLPDAEEKTIGV